MNSIVNLSRRDFLKSAGVVGGGLLLGIHLPSLSESAEPGATTILNAFVRIAPDNTVTVIANHSEMGQGVYTSIPMIVADELDADWNLVRVEPAPVDAAYNHTAFGMQMTGGSTSTDTEWDRLRKMGASARAMLIAAAAEKWSVPSDSCKTAGSMVIHEASGRKITYGELAEAASHLSVPGEIPLKERSQYKIIGKPVKRLDSPLKANGKAIFGIDVARPDMLTAVIARPPVFGAKVKSLDPQSAKASPGVRHVVQVDTGVAVIADNFWSAKKGRDALKVEWDEGPLSALDSIQIRKEYAALAKTAGTTAQMIGDPQSVKPSAKTLEADYELPYLAHATMEPLNCVADVRPDSCEIWTGTQFQTGDRDVAVKVTGLKPEQVQLHTTYLGGGFGRRAVTDNHFVKEAVQASKAVGKPVKVVWTREDDIRGGYYRPMWADHISASLDASGNPVTWEHTIVGQSILEGTPFSGMIKDGIDESSVEGAIDLPYAIPNFRVNLHSPKTGVPVLWWRSVGHSHTAFVVETFVDELAHAAGVDPLEYRRKLIGPEQKRFRRILDAVAEKANWGSPPAAGRGRGIAAHESFGSLVAHVAEVSVTNGALKVHRFISAVDCGAVVNPDSVKAQIEGAIAFALSAALHSEITLTGGRVKQRNFNDYRVLRMREMPEVEVHVVPSGDPMGGIGEPGVPPVAPALANAIFAATGTRIRKLPIGSQDLKHS